MHRWLPLKFVMVVGLMLVAPRPGYSGPVLDDILNTIKLGAHTTQRDETRFATVERDKAVGQTFAVGDKVENVFRIALWTAYWSESWQPDESLVMTLWDSPQKHTAYGRCAIPYERRMWEGAVTMFTLDARVQPHRSYYFELTVEVEPLRPAVTPRAWLLADKRPGFTNGDGRIEGIGIAQNDTPQDAAINGQAYIGGVAQNYRLWFQIHQREQLDRDTLYERAFNRFDLNYVPLAAVRDAVQKRDWERAEQELVRHFENRTDLIPAPKGKPIFDASYNTHDADLVVEHKVPLEGNLTLDLGPTWNHYAAWPERGGVGLTRAGIRKYLASAYAATGNEKYARAWNDMLTQFLVQSPSPLLARVYSPDDAIPAPGVPGLAGASMWSGLSLGARMMHGFSYYAPFIDSPAFTTDVRAAFIINLGEMAEVLEREKGGGNWETQMSDALYEFGLTYPEFKESKQWVQQGFKTLVANALATVRPDGVLQEPTINYHQLVMSRYATAIERAHELGLQVPDEMTKLTEKMYDFVMYSTLPDGTLPLWGDANPVSKADSLEHGAKLFKRDDFAYIAGIAKSGKPTTGSPPHLTSIGFPDGGFYYMRTGWQPDAHYMGIHAGPYGSHGHQDPLSFVVAAFGKIVLIDPGVYTYGTPEAQELNATRSHNTVTVEDRDSRSGQADAWMTSTHFDFFAGHNAGYAGLQEVVHHRRICFVKPFNNHPGLWLVFDDVVNADNQNKNAIVKAAHEAQLRYRFASLPVHSDTATLQARTTDATNNLLVRVLEHDNLKLDMTRGLAAGDWSKLIQVPLATYRQSGQLPLSFTSLLLPFQAATPPSCITTVLPASPMGNGARAAWIEMDNEAVLVIVNDLTSLHDDPKLLQITLPDKRQVSVNGASVALRFIRHGKSWEPASIQGTRLRSAIMDHHILWQSTTKTDVVDVLLSHP